MIQVPIGNTRSNNVEFRRLVLLSRPKVGKTSTAVTLSRKFDESKLGKVWQNLSDTLLLEADLEGDLVLQANKIEVDTINLHALTKPGGRVSPNLPDVLKAVFETVRDQVMNNGKSLVILDTPSELGATILEYYTKTAAAPRTKSNAVDSFAVQRLDTHLHSWIHSTLTSLPCDLVFCIHTKSAGEGFTQKAKADGMEGELPDTIMDFYYTASGNIYRRNMSLIASVQADKRGKRWLYTQVKYGLEAGSRFQSILEDREETNLSQLYAKIDSHLQGDTANE